MIGEMIAIGGGLLAWATVLVRLPPLLNGTAGRRYRHAWLLALSGALYGTLYARAIYVPFDALVGVHDLSCLLSYLAAEAAIYYICLLCSRRPPRLLLPALLVTVTTTVVTFILGSYSLPGSPYEHVPRNAAELLFRVTRNIYGIVLLAYIPMRGIPEAWQADIRPGSRIRTAAVLTAIISAAVSLGLRTVIALLAFSMPAFRPHVELANLIARLPEIVMVLSWPVLLASNRALEWLARPPRHLRDVRTSLRLNRLRKALNVHCKPVLAESPSWRDHLLNPGFQIYRSLIAILDGKCQLQTLTDPQPQVLCKGTHPQDALRLLLALRATLDYSDYTEVVQAYEATSVRLFERRGL